MANIKFEIDGKVYDFAPESFAIDNEGNIILKSKSSAEKRNPFKRVKEGEDFYYIGGYEQLMTMKECSLFYADRYYDCANYCTDAELLRRRALYEKLERCLWRFLWRMVEAEIIILLWIKHLADGMLLILLLKDSDLLSRLLKLVSGQSRK